MATEATENEEILSEENKLDRELADSVKDPGDDDIIKEPKESDDAEEEDSEKSEAAEEDGDEDEEEESKESEADEDTKQALALYKALKSENGAEVLRNLAIRAGLIKADEKVTKEVAEDLTAELTESLGEDWGFLAPKLAPVMKKLVEQVRQEHVRLETSIALEKAWTTLAEETDGDIKNYQDDIDKLSNKYHMGRGVTIVEYLRDLYKIASANKRDSKATEKVLKKIEKNAADRLPRSSEVGEKRVKRSTQLPTLGEAIYEAYQEQKSKRIA